MRCEAIKCKCIVYFSVICANPYERQHARTICTMVRQVWFVLLTALLAVWVLCRLVKCSVCLLTHKMKMIVLTTWYGHTDI